MNLEQYIEKCEELRATVPQKSIMYDVMIILAESARRTIALENQIKKMRDQDE